LKPIDARLLRSLPLPTVDRSGTKDERGRVLVVGGSAEIPGGAILAAVAALRAGAGKLQIATCRSVAVAVAASVPEARVIALPQGRDGELTARCAPRIAREIGACDALLVGPGMHSAAAAGSVVRHALSAGAGATLVADAAALPVFRKARAGRHAVVLTPNAGEMAQMTGLSRARVERDAPRIATQMASTTGAVIVLKGNPTVVAAPNGALFTRRAGNAGLGTSGSGDTLSGVISGLAARGAAPVVAAVWGVEVHARAGDALARAVAPLGFLARELLHEIPGAVARLSR
jgi:hydroxyethylthiazole kinase-like uncharacterized protein yjeF